MTIAEEEDKPIELTSQHVFRATVCRSHENGSGPSRTRMLFFFGRKDQLDVEALRHLVASVSRYLDHAEALEVRAAAARAKPPARFPDVPTPKNL